MVLNSERFSFSDSAFDFYDSLSANVVILLLCVGLSFGDRRTIAGNLSTLA